MSGGTLHFNNFEFEEAVETIRDRIKNNGKTVQQIWDSKDPEEQACAREWGRDWEIPWSTKNLPPAIETLACEHADEYFLNVLGEKDLEHFRTKKLEKQWNKLRSDYIKESIDSHNNTCEHQVFSEKTIERMKEMVETIEKARVYLNKIDYLLSGDDSEETFLSDDDEDED